MKDNVISWTYSRELLGGGGDLIKINSYFQIFLLVLTGDKFLCVPTQQNTDGGALFVLFLITIILFPVRKETVRVRQRMV